ncbi:MAG: sigma-70 family RNA polymerase sigma factor [Nannocystaceae bacterium]|nr:sigma-70 family RNA polymerase sigma factor [Nannocystaceae bacterium]
MPVDDAELLLRWRGGDAEAGRTLIERHAATLHRFFVNKLPEWVDELSQRTLLACVEARERIDPARSFRAYLLGIARFQLLRALREHYRDVAGVPEQWSAAQLVPSPTAAVADDERRALLLRALRHLSIDTQIALELHYWEDLGVAEIATVMGEPEGTVKSRLARGRATLRQVLEQLEADGEQLEQTLRNLDGWAAELRAQRRDG